MTRSSIAALVLLLLATVATLVAPSRVGLGSDSVKFTVWGMPFEDRLFRDRYASGWERESGAVVEYGRFADVETKYNAWHTQGRGPDVMRMEVTWYPGFIERGLLEPLDAYIADPKTGLSAADMAAIPAYLREIIEVDGHIYAIPQDSAQFGLFYNRTIFDDYNRQHPGSPIPYPDESWTWETLRDAARKLTVIEDGRQVRAGFDFAIWAWPFLTLFAQAGGTVWSDDGATCLLNTQAGVDALDFLRAMQADGSFEPKLVHYTDALGADALFAQGRTAMMMDGSWRVPMLEGVAPALDFAVAPLPRGKVRAVICGSVFWAISKHATNKAAGWAMLRWLVREENAAAYWDTLRVAPPADTRVLRSERFRRTSGIPRPDGGFEVPPMDEAKFEARAAWLLHAVTPDPATGRTPGFIVTHPRMSELQKEITIMLNEFLKPGSVQSSGEALDGVVRAIHGIIDRDRAARGLPRIDRSQP